MEKLLITVLSLSYLVSCRQPQPEVRHDITAQLEVFDGGRSYDEFHRFMKISLTNHSSSTDYYLPGFYNDQVYDNPGYDNGGWGTLADALGHYEAFSSLGLMRRCPEIALIWLQYSHIPGYDSLRVAAYKEHAEKKGLVPSDSDSTILKQAPRYVFIGAGETVSKLVNIAPLYEMDTETVITYKDSGFNHALYSDVTAGHYHLYKDIIQCSDTIIISK